MLEVINAALELAADPSVMVVGDHRQEIYGFTHGGGPHAALATPETCLPSARPWVHCKLQQSFRVSRPTAEFLNSMLRHPDDDAMAGVPATGASKPIYIFGDMRSGAGIDAALHELLERYRPDQIAILAPSVNSAEYGCPRLAAMLADRLGIPLYSTHKQRADVSDDLLKGKMLVSTYHQSKGDEREAVVARVDAVPAGRQPGAGRGPGGPQRAARGVHPGHTRLVLFHQHNVPAYPGVDVDALGRVAEVRVAVPFAPQPLPPLTFAMIERRTGWVVNFAAEQTLAEMDALMEVQPAVVLGPPVVARPTNTVETTSGTLEDVSCYFSPAIMAAAERQRLLETVPGTRAQGQMETEVRCSRRCRDVPPAYSNVVADVQAHRPPGGCHSWLMLSVLHNTLVRHNFRHELRQMQDFSWIGENEAAYFRECTDSVLNVTRRHETFDFNAQGKRVCQPMKVGCAARWMQCGNLVHPVAVLVLARADRGRLPRAAHVDVVHALPVRPDLLRDPQRAAPGERAVGRGACCVHGRDHGAEARARARGGARSERVKERAKSTARRGECSGGRVEVPQVKVLLC